MEELVIGGPYGSRSKVEELVIGDPYGSRSKVEELVIGDPYAFRSKVEELVLRDPYGSRSKVEELVLGDPYESRSKMEELVLSSNFETIRPSGVKLDRDDHNNVGARVCKSADSLNAEVSGIDIKNYGSLGSIGPSKFSIEKDHNAALTSEIEGIMRRHTDSLMHALDGLSARLSQFESRSSHLENSVNELKLSMGNNHGISDGRLRRIENVLREVQSSVHDIKDKQDVMDAHIQLSIMQISKTSQQSQSEPTAAAAASAPESSLPQLPPAAIPQAPPSFQMANAPLSGHIIPPGQISSLPRGDHSYYLPQPVQIQDSPIPQYQLPQETPYPPPPQTYNPTQQQQQQLIKPPIGAPFQHPYGAPSQPYDHNPPSTGLDSGFHHTSYDQTYIPYSGPPPPAQVGGGYNQLPSARILPKAGGSSSDGGNNRVPVEDVVDKVTTMGFPRDQVRTIIRKLTENGQSVDLNTVLDKLMNDGEAGGWYGRR